MTPPKQPKRLPRLQESDQAASGADQTASDGDQTASDTDQTASDRDQAQAESDQRASNRDQVASDRDLVAHPDPAGKQAHRLSRADRVKATLDRDAATLVRGQVSGERDEQADQRDENASERDNVAHQRDRVADEHDRRNERLTSDLGHSDTRILGALKALEEMRASAAGQRAHAAADRDRAAADRKAAAKERELLLAELEHSHVDAVTGAYRRGMGELALVHEMERSGDLVFAYIDLSVKTGNDREGRTAGDEALRELMDALRSLLRPYDPIVRWGWDEFVCTISDIDLAAARDRFADVGKRLAEGTAGASITVGLAAVGQDDSLEDLVARAVQDQQRDHEAPSP